MAYEAAQAVYRISIATGLGACVLDQNLNVSYNPLFTLCLRKKNPLDYRARHATKDPKKGNDLLTVKRIKRRSANTYK